MTKNEVRVRAFEAILAAYLKNDGPRMTTAEMIQRASGWASDIVIIWENDA